MDVRKVQDMRKADGTYRSEVDQKEICLEDEEDKYRTEFSDKSTCFELITIKSKSVCEDIIH